MSSVRRRGKTLTAYWRKADGSQGSKGGFPDTDEGRKAAAQHGMDQEEKEHRKAAGDLIEVELPVKSPALEKHGVTTLAGYVDDFLSSHLMADKTRVNYRDVLKKHIVPKWGSMTFREIKSLDVRKWFRSMEAQGFSKALLKKIKSTASTMCEDAIEDEIAVENPFVGIRLRASSSGRRRVPTPAEYVKILKYLPEPWHTRVELIAETGMRIEEVMGLERADIQGTVVKIHHVLNDLGVEGFKLQSRTKTGKPRITHISKEMSDHLLILPQAGIGSLKDFPEWCGIFPPIRHSTFNSGIWETACRAAGLDWKPAPRDMRRAFATWAKSGGADLDEIRQALGHRRLSTTDIYLGDREEAADDAMRAAREFRKGKKEEAA